MKPLFLKNTAEEEDPNRVAFAKLLLGNLSKGSDWFRIDSLKSLSQYLDISFVKPKLLEIYKNNDSERLKQAIKDLYENKLDISDVLKRKKEAEELDALLAEYEKENSELEDTEVKENISSDINLLKALKYSSINYEI